MASANGNRRNGNYAIIKSKLYTHNLIKVRNFYNKQVTFFVFFIADLCSAEHLPEVEIFSLLEEQIPKYKLRADVLTQFGGYENQVKFTTINIRTSFLISILCFQDWFVPSPALPIPAGGLALNKDQIRETLNYFRK